MANDFLLVQGSLAFARAEIVGTTLLEEGPMEAFYAFTPLQPQMQATWRITASSVQLNWTRIDATGIGSDPFQPEKSILLVAPPGEAAAGEESFVEASLSSRLEGDAAGILLLSSPGVAANARAWVFGEVDLWPAKNETWYTGRVDGNDFTTGEGRLLQSYNVSTGNLYGQQRLRHALRPKAT